MLINGEWIDADRKIKVVNPLNQELIDTVPMATVSQVKRAIDGAADYHFQLTAWERYEILNTFCQLLKKHKEEFANLISRESGKPIKESFIEIERAYHTFLFSAEEAKRINGEILPIDALRQFPQKWGLVIKEPIGVIVAITPFNYPLNLAAHKVGPAIAANNAVVLKPSSLAPLTAIKMAELFLKAGLPKEMLQVVTGDVMEIGDELIQNPLVKKVTFTGSVEVGKAICKKIGMKKVTMELGGNDPLIILEDADIEGAVSGAVLGAFGNNGQRCTAVKRIIIQESIADKFIQLFVEKTKVLSVGDQMDPSTDIGPLITEKAAKKVEKMVDLTIKKGGKLLYGAKRQGSLYWPTIIDYVDAKDPLVMEETFGPVAPIIRVKSFEEAISVANCTNYGLQSGIFTNDLRKAIEAIKRIKAGAVIINGVPGFRAEHLPFGGVKDSGLGREGVRYAIDDLTNFKTVVL